MDDKVEAAGGNAPHLVHRDGREVRDAVAGLLEKLAPRRVFHALARLDAPAREKPRARERAGGLFHDEDPPGIIEAGDDRGDARPLRDQVFLGVGVGKGGSVGVRGNVGVGTGVRVGTGVSDGEGVGHPSGPTRFQV